MRVCVCVCNNTPAALRTYELLRNNSVLAGDSSSGI